MSKQEKIVCAAVKFIFPNNGEKDEVVVPYVKSHKEEYHVFLLLTKLGVWRSTRYREELGFATSFQRFVDPVEAMKIAVKTGQYPDYELMKRKALEEIGYAKENERHNESVGVLGFKLFVADIPKLVSRVKELDKLLGRDYLLPEDLY